MPAHCSADIAPVPEALAVTDEPPFRTIIEPFRIGSTEWMRNGSMIVRNGGSSVTASASFGPDAHAGSLQLRGLGSGRPHPLWVGRSAPAAAGGCRRLLPVPTRRRRR